MAYKVIIINEPVYLIWPKDTGIIAFEIDVGLQIHAQFHQTVSYLTLANTIRDSLSF